MESGKEYKVIFGLSVLPKLFPELKEVAHQEAVLATIFDVLCWQIRLTLLDPHSIYRVGKISYHREDSQYRVIARVNPLHPPVWVRISLQWANVNRCGYGELNSSVRECLPDHGIMPPQRMMMIKAMTIEGDRQLAEMIYERFYAFPETLGQEKLFELLKQSAREYLVDQPNAWLALLGEVAKYYGVECPHE